MAATKMFLIRWHSSSTNLKTTSRKSSRLLPFQSSGLPESRLDFLEVVWTSWKSSGLPRSHLDFLEVIWTSWKSSHKVFFNIKWSPSLRLNFQSSQETYFKVNCINNLCVDQTTFSLMWREIERDVVFSS
ncbi:hypothetical protein IGI04_019051 [Brassica rapa subsp. trilocularis]|uniref:Uncharacterized protein n=1 Tax=Brassica rapa subsp. trilocularis TaxID=1813537 RepID=A0ABQ7MEP8_BRACM|nr:hypothetical protein IGI04_019051 [Brassica rapa subsp. trilocularis]